MVTALDNRVPPQDTEAEQAVLGSIILDSSVFFLVGDRLQANDFYVPSHKELFFALQRMSLSGSAIDVLTLTSQLRDHDKLTAVGGVAYLSQLVRAVPTVANVEYYAKRVEEKSLLRRLISAATDVVKLGYESYDDISQILDTAEKKILDLSKNRLSGDMLPLHDVLMSSYDQLSSISKNKDDMLNCLSTGFVDLDKIISGLRSSDLFILAARPSMGKTALALNLAQNIAIRSKKIVAIFTFEMSAPQLALRMLSSEGSIDAQVFRTGELQDSDWEKLAMAIGVLAEAPIFIDDTPGSTIFDMRAKLRRLKSRQGLDLVIIDYLQLITGRGKDNRQQEISDISRALKLMAREFDVPILALSQLSRAVEQRQDKHPMLSDLRESGSIEQDADVVAFLYREDYYDLETEKKNIVEIVIGKQRNGPTGKIELLFLKNYNKFLSFDKGS